MYYMISKGYFANFVDCYNFSAKFGITVITLRLVGLEVSVSAFHAVRRRFVPKQGHTKDHHEKWY